MDSLAPPTSTDARSRSSGRRVVAHAHATLLPRVRGLTSTARQAEPLGDSHRLGATERRLRFRTLPQAVSVARRVLQEWDRDIEPTLFYDLSLCVSELVTLVVQERSRADGDDAELTVRLTGTMAHAQVRNLWRRHSAAAPPRLEHGALGAVILDRVADRWGVGSGDATLLWCEIDLASDGRSRRRPLMIGAGAS